MEKPKIIIFASGTSDGGGTGFENLVQATKSDELDAQIVAVVSNNERGGVRDRADRLGVPFIIFKPDSEYTKIMADTGAEWAVLSGWFKKVYDLDPKTTINIHPALLSQLNGKFGGHGMYGDRIHEAVKAAFDAGEITESGFTMHFVTDEMDRGPAFFEHRIPLHTGMTASQIRDAVRDAEREWQPKITNLVVHRKIRWDGADPKSLVVPAGIIEE